MLKLLCIAAGVARAVVLLVLLALAWRMLATAPWPLIALAVVGLPVAIWLHVVWWAPKERQRQAGPAHQTAGK